MTTSSDAPERFQISADAAERYEAAFVPALFAQWAPLLCEAAGVRPGQAVLDVACGTGIVARTAAGLVEPGGRVVGLDLNEAMLAVARRLRPDLTWRRGDAADLPFPDASFDTVLCQMALMFLPDRRAALREMGRVTRPGGTVAVLVPSPLEAQDAFAPFVDMAARHVGPEARSLLTGYFVCGGPEALGAEAERAGLAVVGTASHVGHYRAASVDAFVTTEVESTPLVERMSAGVYDRIRREAHAVLSPFTEPGGSVDAPFSVDVAVARRP